jgi:hypothetical protein
LKNTSSAPKEGFYALNASMSVAQVVSYRLNLSVKAELMGSAAIAVSIIILSEFKHQFNARYPLIILLLLHKRA